MSHNIPPVPEQPSIFTNEERQALVNEFDRVYPEQLHAGRRAVRQARDRAQYVRNQKGHSLTLHLLFGWIVLWIPALYITCSPNHYWHA